MKKLDIQKVKTIEGVLKYLKQEGIQNPVIKIGDIFIENTDALVEEHGNLALFEENENLEITIQDSEDQYDLADSVKVLVDEPFGCCGKLYLHDFEDDVGLKGIRPMNKALLKVSELLAGLRGYTYLGFVHKSNDLTVQAAKQMGFKAIKTFTNRRSKNKLSEMCKILGK